MQVLHRRLNVNIMHEGAPTIQAASSVVDCLKCPGMHAEVAFG